MQEPYIKLAQTVPADTLSGVISIAWDSLTENQQSTIVQLLKDDEIELL